MASSRYIYLNTYKNGYLYVGSHSWNGPVGVLDSSYKGSSNVARHYGWLPVKQELIEVVDKDGLRREGEVIRKYCSEYGIAPCAKFLAHSHSNVWVDKFKDGLMLNCHCNDLSAALSSKTYEQLLESSLRLRTPESVKKSSESRRALGSKYCLSDGFVGTPIEISEHLGIKYGTVSGAVNKVREFGSYTLSSGVVIYKEGADFSVSEVNRKRVETVRGQKRRLSEVHVPPKRHPVEFNGVVYKSTSTALRENGLNVNWCSQINKKFNNGAVEVLHHGYCFHKLIVETE